MLSPLPPPLPPPKKKLTFSSALDDGTYMIKYDNQTIQSALTAVSMYGKGIFWNCVLFVLTVFSLFLPLPVVSIQSCFETSRFVTSLFIRGVKLFHALGLKNEDIHPKCFSCWLQTTLEVSKTFAISLLEFVSKQLVSKRLWIETIGFLPSFQGFSENLHALFCMAENAVGSRSTRPDDILTLYSGK